MQVNQHAVRAYQQPGLDSDVEALLEKKSQSSCPCGVTFADFRGSPGSSSVDFPFTNELKVSGLALCPFSIISASSSHQTFPEKQANGFRLF